MAIVIVKNNTGTSVVIEDLGITLAPAEVRNFTDTFEFVDCTESDDLKALTSSSAITINDGTNDLGMVKGLEHLEIESVHLDYIQDDEIGGSASSKLPYSGVVTNTIFALQSSFTDIVFISAEYQNDINTLEWDQSNKERILIKEDGDYNITATSIVRVSNPSFANSYYRLIKNNSTVISEEVNLNTYTSEKQQVMVDITVPLVQGDYITSQCKMDSGSTIDITQSQLEVRKQEGVKGDTGPSGGATIDTQDNGTTITTDSSILNFQGNGVVVTDAGSGKANITINNNPFQPKFIQVYDSTGYINVNSTTKIPITFDTQEIRDVDTFDHSISNNNTRIYILVDGWYDVSYSIDYDSTSSSRRNIVGAFRKNGSTILDRTTSSSYTRNNTDDHGTTHMSGVLQYFTAGDYVELVGWREGSSGTVNTYPDSCWACLKLVRGD